MDAIPRKLVATLVALDLVVAGAGLYALGRTHGKEAVPRPVAAPPEPAPTPVLVAPPSTDRSLRSSRHHGIKTDIRPVMRQVSRLRGLKVLRPTSHSALTPLELRTLTKAPEPKQSRRAQDYTRLMQTFHILPPDHESVDRTRGSAPTGFYDPRTNRLYVRADTNQLPALQERVIAHELAHSLQDQHFDLEKLTRRTRSLERDLALRALVEGDAVTIERRWARAHLTSAERRALQSYEGYATAAQTLARVPRSVLAYRSFPYEHGPRFVSHLLAAGGYRAVNRAFRHPPQTTEQILHPEKYTAGETGMFPVQLTSLEFPWEYITATEMGEMDVLQMMRPLGRARAARIAAGWNGGRADLYVREEVFAGSMQLLYDTRADAAEACSAVPDWYRAVADGNRTSAHVMRGDGEWMSFWCADLTVSVAIAPLPEIAQRLVGLGR